MLTGLANVVLNMWNIFPEGYLAARSVRVAICAHGRVLQLSQLIGPA